MKLLLISGETDNPYSLEGEFFALMVLLVCVCGKFRRALYTFATEDTELL